MEGGDLSLSTPPPPLQGPVTCASWIRRPENRLLVITGRSRILEIFSYDPNTGSLSPDPMAEISIEEEGGDPMGFAVHPSGDEIVCSTKTGCKLFELNLQDSKAKILAKDLPPLQSAGPQTCLSFSTDGSRFATGGKLRLEFLVSTSTDGSARIWKINDGVPLTCLTRNSDEKIECCRFSRDGTKPFLFYTVQKGGEVVISVWDISTWNKIGYKRLLRKPISVLSVSLDGKYLALGSNDGDLCVVEVKKMEVCHWSKKLHLGTCISSIEFCPTERVVLSTSNQWGSIVTKLSVPADWKEWQIYVLLLGLFLASAVLFYFFYEYSDSFWNFPLGRTHPARPSIETFVSDPKFADDQSPW